MIDENLYEWKVYYKNVFLGRTNTEGRVKLVREKVSEPITHGSIRYELDRKECYIRKTI